MQDLTQGPPSVEQRLGCAAKLRRALALDGKPVSEILKSENEAENLCGLSSGQG